MCDFLTLTALFQEGTLKCFHRRSGGASALDLQLEVGGEFIISNKSLKWGVWNLLHSDIHLFCHSRKENVKSKFAYSSHFRKKKTNQRRHAMWTDSFECINKLTRLLLLLWCMLKPLEWNLKVNQEHWWIELEPSSQLQFIKCYVCIYHWEVMQSCSSKLMCKLMQKNCEWHRP